MPLELVLTVVPFLIISVLFYFTVVVQEKMLHKDPNPEVVIDVTAFQWNWKFGYQKIDFNDGTFDYDGVDAARKAAMASKPEGIGRARRGARRPDPRAEPRGPHLPELRQGRDDRHQHRDPDPGAARRASASSSRSRRPTSIHGFWVPEFLFKRDVMPDPKANHSDNVFQISEIQKTGAFVGRCTEMCGTYHSMMNFEVRVVEPNDFKAYLQYRAIAGKTNAEALQAIDQPPTAVTTHPFDTRRGEQAHPRRASRDTHAHRSQAVRVPHRVLRAGGHRSTAR